MQIHTVIKNQIPANRTLSHKVSLTSPHTFSDFGCLSTNNMHHTAVHPTAHTYSTSNTPPLTTHLALNVLGTLRGQCPCDEYRDEKRSDWICHVCTPLLNVRANSPETVTRSYDCEETEAMDQCSRGIVLAMLESYARSSVVDGRAEALRWYTSDDEKVAGGFPRPRERFSLQWEVALYRISLRASSYRGR